MEVTTEDKLVCVECGGKVVNKKRTLCHSCENKTAQKKYEASVKGKKTQKARNDRKKQQRLVSLSIFIDCKRVSMEKERD